METSPSSPALPVISSTDKLWAILSHLSGFIGAPLLLPLIVYLVMKQDSAYVRANAREALNFHLSLLIYSLACIPLLFVLVGIPLLIALAIGSFILAIIAAIKASDGECYLYPLTIRFIS